MKDIYRKKGSTIIEVLIASTLIAVAIIAALSLSSRSERQSNFNKLQNRATIYNNEALDWLRNMRSELGWGSFINELDLDTSSSTITYCLNSLPANSAEFIALSAGNCGNGSYILGTIFARELTINFAQAAAGSTAVTITTKWTDNTQHTVTQETVLTRW